MNKNLESFLCNHKIEQNLPRNPHKFALLLSVIYLYNINERKENKIYLDDELLKIFNAMLSLLSPSINPEKTSIEYPFYHLTSSKFWILKIKEGKENEYHDIINKYNARFTLHRIKEIFEYAYLSNDVDAELRIKENRNNIISLIKQAFNIAPKPYNQHGKEHNSSTQNFISYLKTLQRVNGGNENALAEFQAQNPLFAHIVAPHPLRETLVQDLREGKHCIILTGHAGDGKTTLAFAVYRHLCGLSPNQRVQELNNSRISFSIEGSDAILIKDLSEQERSRDADLMADLLDSNKRSLLVSNTGALRELFISQTPSSTEKIEVESALLSCLSKKENDIEEKNNIFHFRNRTFKIYNLALRDNLPLAEQVLENMLAPNLWQGCANCQRTEHCPIHFNRTLLTDPLSPAKQRIFLAYRRLQAYGIRLTMRQLTEHIAYCLTGGMDGSQLCQAEAFPAGIGRRQYFYNLFFGGDGPLPEASVADMAAIKGIQGQQLGSHPLPCMDKQLWHVLPSQIDDLGLPDITQKIFQRLTQRGSKQGDPFASAAARLEARRLLYFCATPKDHQRQERLQTEFLRSPSILLHKQLNTRPQLEPNKKRYLLTCLFHVLQEHFTGMHLPTTPSQSGHNTLYITLNRPTPLLRQSVQAVQCAVSWRENFDLCVNTTAEGSIKLQLIGRRSLRDIKPLELTVPFLDYMLSRHEGALGTLPRATFGQQMDTLKSQIIRCMRDGDDPQDLHMLRYCSDYSLVQDDYILGDDKLEVIRGTH